MAKILVSFILLSGLTAGAATLPVTHLAPVRQFDLSTCIAGETMPVTHAVTGTAKGLLFLVSPPRVSSAPPQYLVKTDPDGTCRGTITLPERVSPHSVVLNAQGQAIVLRTQGVQQVERLVVNGTGQTANRTTLEQPAFQLVSVGSHIVGVSTTGSLFVFDEAGRVSKTLVSSDATHADPLHLTAISEHSVLLVEGKNGNARIVDILSDGVTAVSLAPEDFAAVRSRYGSTDQSKAVLVTSVSADPAGFAYLSLSGIRLAEGALILKVDQQGNVVGRFRCALPAQSLHAVSGNPEGFLAPSLIQVVGNSLYILDRKGSVAQYTLP